MGSYVGDGHHNIGPSTLVDSSINEEDRGYDGLGRLLVRNDSLRLQHGVLPDQPQFAGTYNNSAE